MVLTHNFATSSMPVASDGHGVAFEYPLLIVRDDHLLLIARDDAVMSMHKYIQLGAKDRPLEIIIKRWGEDTFMYTGSFRPKPWWLPFNWHVTGFLEELVSAYSP